MAEKILIVDDEPNILRLIGFALEQEGYEIVSAENGFQALSALENDEPDLVVLDLMLPDMSGIDICRAIREKEETQALPVIMLTARAQVGDKITGLEAGADEYLTKPIDSDEMVARIKALFARTARLRQSSRGKVGIVYGCMGARGGIGTSTLVLNLTAAMAQQDLDVIAVELHSGFGTFAGALNRRPPRNLADLLELEESRIDVDQVRSRLVALPGGGQALMGPQTPPEFGTLAAEKVDAVLRKLILLTDHVVIDLPHDASDATKAALALCDHIIMTVDASPATVEAGRVQIGALEQWGVSQDLAQAVVINRTPPTMGMTTNDAADKLGVPVIGMIPPSGDAQEAALQRGLPLVLHEPQSMMANNIREMLSSLLPSSPSPAQPAAF